MKNSNRPSDSKPLNREERRKLERQMAKLNVQVFGGPKSHLHDTHPQEALDRTKEQIKEFLKTYDYKDSPYEKDIESFKELRPYLQQGNVRLGPIRLSAGWEVLDITTGQRTTSEVFLLQYEKGWFIHFTELNIYQNVLVLVLESGFSRLLSKADYLIQVSVGEKTYIIPNLHKLARQAFDSLSLKFDDKWVDE